MTQEQDKVIRKSQGSVVLETDREIMAIALNLPKADVNADGKVGKQEMLDFMLQGFDIEARNALKNQCVGQPIGRDVVLFQQAMEKAAIVAVNMGSLEEVVVPSVGSVCATARGERSV